MALRTNKIVSADRAKTYFQNSLAREDYYTRPMYPLEGFNVRAEDHVPGVLISTLARVVPEDIPWVSLYWLFAVIALLMVGVVAISRIPEVERTVEDQRWRGAHEHSWQPPQRSRRQPPPGRAARRHPCQRLVGRPHRSRRRPRTLPRGR